MQLSADEGVGEEALLDSGLDVRNDVGGEIGLVLARAHGQLADEEVQRLVGLRLGLYDIQQLRHQVGGAPGVEGKDESKGCTLLRASRASEMRWTTSFS